MLDLVGRKEELNNLLESVESMKNGEGSTILISGEAGIGKTRLIKEFKERADLRSVNVMTGSAEEGVMEPYLIFTDAMGEKVSEELFHEEVYNTFTEVFAIDDAGLLLGNAVAEEEEMDPDIFAGMLTAVQNFVKDSLDRSGDQKSGLGRLEYGDMKIMIEQGKHIYLTAIVKGEEHQDMERTLKEKICKLEEDYGKMIKEWDGGVEDIKGISEELSELTSEKFRMKQNLEGVKLKDERLKIAARTMGHLVKGEELEPLLFILEDIHWADESSIFLLDYLVRNIRKENIMILCTFRPADNKDVKKSVDMMEDEEIVKVIRLSELQNDEIRSLIGDLYTPNEFSPDFLNDLMERCEGNPFFLIESLRQMRDEGWILKKEGKYVIERGEYILPSSVEDIVNKRVDMLDMDAISLVEYASCMGREFSKDSLLYYGLIDDLDFALEEVSNAGIIDVLDGNLTFTHAIFQQTIYNEINLRWKRIYHKEIGEYYEKEFIKDEVLYDMAKHFSRSKEKGKAVKYCWKAGEKASNLYAPEQGIQFYDLALEALDEQKINEDTKEMTANIHYKKGVLFYMTGDWEKAEYEYKISLKHFLSTGNKKKTAEVKNNLGYLYRGKGMYDKAYSIIKESYDIFNEINDEKGISRALGKMGVLYAEQGEYDKAQKCYEKSLDIAERLKEKNEINQALGNIVVLNYYRCNYQQALDYAGRQLDIAKEIGDKHSQAQALGNIGSAYNELNEYVKAMEHFEKGLKITKEISDKQITSYIYGNMGVVHKKQGNFKEAMECYRRRLEISEQLGDKRSKSYALGNIGNVYRDMGDYENAIKYYKKDLKLSKELGDRKGRAITMGNIGDLYKKSGDHETAKKYYDKAIHMGRELELEDVLCNFLYQKADLLFKNEDISQSSVLLEEAKKRAREIDENNIMFLCQILTLKILAKDDKDPVRKKFQEMLKYNEDTGERAVIYYVLYDIFGDNEYKEKALELYRKLYNKTPKVDYKKRVEELEEN